MRTLCLPPNITTVDCVCAPLTRHTHAHARFALRKMATESKASGGPHVVDAEPTHLYVPFDDTREDDRDAMHEAAAWLHKHFATPTHAAVYQRGLVVPVTLDTGGGKDGEDGEDGAAPTAGSYAEAAKSAIAACQFAGMVINNPMFTAARHAAARFVSATLAELDGGIAAMWGTDVHTTATHSAFMDAVCNGAGVVSPHSAAGQRGPVEWAAVVANTAAAANGAIHDILVAAIRAPNPLRLPALPETDEDEAGDARSTPAPEPDSDAFVFDPPTDDAAPLWTGAAPPPEPVVAPIDAAQWPAWVSAHVAKTKGVIQPVADGTLVVAVLTSEDENPLTGVAAVVRTDCIDAEPAMLAPAYGEGDEATATALAHHIVTNALLTDALLKPLLGVIQLPGGFPEPRA